MDELGLFGCHVAQEMACSLLLGLRILGSSRRPKWYSSLATAGDANRPVVNEPQRLKGLRIALTTPSNYAVRLVEGLAKDGAHTICCPTIAVERTPEILSEVQTAISSLDCFKGVAFTSRSSIASIAQALAGKDLTLNKEGPQFLVGALGKDAELIQELCLFKRAEERVKLVVPPVATPEALVEQLGDGHGQRLLCPVPLVLGLQEPRVIPDFLGALEGRGWDAVRLNAYITRWTGGNSIVPLLRGVSQVEGVDALVFTSTAEVEGLLKSLDAHRLTLSNIRNGRRGKRCVLVAYGPVTAKGASQLGVEVDLVGHEFHSFMDLIQLLVSHFKRLSI